MDTLRLAGGDAEHGRDCNSFAAMAMRLPRLRVPAKGVRSFHCQPERADEEGDENAKEEDAAARIISYEPLLIDGRPQQVFGANLPNLQAAIDAETCGDVLMSECYSPSDHNWPSSPSSSSSSSSSSFCETPKGPTFEIPEPLSPPSPPRKRQALSAYCLAPPTARFFHQPSHEDFQLLFRPRLLASLVP